MIDLFLAQLSANLASATRAQAAIAALTVGQFTRVSTLQVDGYQRLLRLGMIPLASHRTPATEGLLTEVAEPWFPENVIDFAAAVRRAENRSA